MDPRPHAVDALAVAADLGVEPARGLSTAEAERRAREGGANALEASEHEPLWRMVIDSMTEPFVLLLALAGGLAIVVGEVRDGLLVLAGLLPIVGADASRSASNARSPRYSVTTSAPAARVRRDGVAAMI